MSASSYRNHLYEYASAEASMLARLNRVSPETTPGVHPWRNSSKYVEDKPDVEAMQTCMTLFPFSYEGEPIIVNTDGSFSVNVSPKKKKSPPSTIKEVTPIATRKKSRSKHNRMTKLRVSFDDQRLLDLYMAHPHLEEALLRQFPDLPLPSAGMQPCDVSPSRLFRRAHMMKPSTCKSHQNEKATELSFLMTPPKTTTTSVDNDIQVLEHAMHNSQTHPDCRSPHEFRQCQHPYRQVLDPMWHSEFDEQLLHGGVFPELGGDFFSALDHIDLDQQMPWVPPPTNMWG